MSGIVHNRWIFQYPNNQLYISFKVLYILVNLDILNCRFSSSRIKLINFGKSDIYFHFLPWLFGCSFDSVFKNSSLFLIDPI